MKQSAICLPCERREKMPASPAKIKYIENYRKENCRYIPIRFDKRKEEHKRILEWLDSKNSKSEYIRNLILKDMNKQSYNAVEWALRRFYFIYDKIYAIKLKAFIRQN